MMKYEMKTLSKPLTKPLIVAGIIVAAVGPITGNARHNDNSAYDNPYNNSAYDHAKVVQVDPVIETIRVNKPVEQCWDERVNSQHSYSNRNSAPRHYSRTPEILGGIIGAIVGNQVGSGRGKKVATAAGAVLGVSIGRDTKYRNRANNSSNNQGHGAYTVVRQCELVDNYTTREQVVGYDVAYSYLGNVYHTQTEQHPGRKIKVRVTVDPV